MARTHFFLNISLGILLSAATTYADETVTFDDFEGEWRSVKTEAGSTRTASLVWRPDLAGQFYELRYSLHDGPNSGSADTQIFSGAAFYRYDEDDRASAFWADSNGDLFSVSSSFTHDGLISEWGDGKSKKGRTQYKLTENDHMIVTDWIQVGAEWVQFNKMEYVRTDMANRESKTGTPGITGIGGVFFRGKSPATLAAWYETHLGVNPPPSSYEAQPWQQEAGPTVFAAFEHDTEYFGDPQQGWMVNFRVRELDALVEELRSVGIKVDVDPETYPNGRFARLHDPEGNPIELWEPAK